MIMAVSSLAQRHRRVSFRVEYLIPMHSMHNRGARGGRNFASPLVGEGIANFRTRKMGEEVSSQNTYCEEAPSPIGVCHTTVTPSPHPNSSLPEFGILEWQQSDTSDFCWERAKFRDPSCRAFEATVRTAPLTH